MRPLRSILAAAALVVAVTTAAPAQAATTPRAPKASASAACKQADYQSRFLGTVRTARPDVSFMRFTWQPRLCRASGVYSADSLPVMYKVGSLQGVGLDLDAPRRTSAGVEYYGRIRSCLPLGAGYKGISFSGTACTTVGTATIRAYVSGSRVIVGYSATTYTWAGKGERFGWTTKLL